ncbi:MAG: hypothetical protein QM820_56065 [Minicystis sp.]
MLDGEPVWELILEQCADMFGVTVRSRLGQLVLFCAVIFVIGLVLLLRWGLGSLVLPALLLGVAVAAARQVTAMREATWRAACHELDAPGQRPADVRGQVLAPTAASLAWLATAVDHVRRGEYAAAGELLPQIERARLRAEEVQLLDAVRAMVSLGLGSTHHAAKQAVVALPTGSADLDACLGRTLLADAWDDPQRLRAIHAAWTQAGVKHGPLARLSTLTRLRIDTRALDAVDPPEARELADEARALGDDALAAELDMRSRPAAYR